MAISDTFVPDPAVECLGERLRAQQHTLARRWRGKLNDTSGDSGAPDLHDSKGSLSTVLDEIAISLTTGVLAASPGAGTSVNAALLLGDLRYTQGVPIADVVTEFHGLEDLLYAFIEDEAGRLTPAPSHDITAGALRSARLQLRELERCTLDSYARGYVRNIEGLTERFRHVNRLVSHEMRRPLSVLRVLARTLTVAAGDVDAVRMVEILDRSVLRLADATGELDCNAAQPITR